MADVHAAFACEKCGGTRFREIMQFTYTCTTVPTDPVTNPIIIECAGDTAFGSKCMRWYRQTADWSWQHIDRKGIPL